MLAKLESIASNHAKTELLYNNYASMRLKYMMALSQTQKDNIILLVGMYAMHLIYLRRMLELYLRRIGIVSIM